jgi:predicted acylesterase/phospholipase RssA
MGILDRIVRRGARILGGASGFRDLKRAKPILADPVSDAVRKATESDFSGSFAPTVGLNKTAISNGTSQPEIPDAPDSTTMGFDKFGASSLSLFRKVMATAVHAPVVVEDVADEDVADILPNNTFPALNASLVKTVALDDSRDDVLSVGLPPTKVVETAPVANKPNVPTNNKPQFKEVNLEGGGGKGVAYIGALQELERRGLLNGVECFSGASVGAMSALFMALGADLKRLQATAEEPNSLLFGDWPLYDKWLKEESLPLHERLLKETGIDAFEEQLGTSLSDSTILAAAQITNAMYQQGALASGDKLLQFIKKVCEELINNAAKKVGPAESQAHKDFLALFKDKSNPTFNEIAAAIEKFPQAGLHHVSMAITGPLIMTENGAQTRFHIQADKDNPVYADKGVADTARISAALPGAFSAVEGSIDGGVMKNVGAISNAGKDLPIEQRLILAFDRAPKGVLQSFLSGVTGSAGGFFTQYALGVNHHEVGAKNLADAQAGKLGVYIPIQYGPVGTLSIPPTPENAKAAIEAGRESMRKALDAKGIGVAPPKLEQANNLVDEQANDNRPKR